MLRVQRTLESLIDIPLVHVKMWKEEKKLSENEEYSLRVKDLFHSFALKGIDVKINSMLRTQ